MSLDNVTSVRYFGEETSGPDEVGTCSVSFLVYLTILSRQTFFYLTVGFGSLSGVLLIIVIIIIVVVRYVKDPKLATNFHFSSIKEKNKRESRE